MTAFLAGLSWINPISTAHDNAALTSEGSVSSCIAAVAVFLPQGRIHACDVKSIKLGQPHTLSFGSAGCGFAVIAGVVAGDGRLDRG